MTKLFLILSTSLFILTLSACFDDNHEHGDNSHSHEAPANNHDSLK